MPLKFQVYGPEPDFTSYPREALAVNWHKLPSMHGPLSSSQKQIADTSPPHSPFSRTLVHALEMLQANNATMQPSHFRKELFFLPSSARPSPPSQSPLKENLPPLNQIAEPYQLASFRKELFFFCGSLMDPATLSQVLSLKKRRILQPATITGYRCKLWESEVALLDGSFGAQVKGFAFEVESADQGKLLEEYETKHYRIASCRIRLEDGSRLSGKTFVWQSDVGKLHNGLLF